MKKLGRKIFMVVSILLIALALTINVNAAQEDTYGYEDFDEGTTTSTEQNTTNETTENNNNETKTDSTEQETTQEETETESDVPNTATTAHAQAGAFENSVFVAATAILALSIGFGYKKFKKYNF